MKKKSEAFEVFENFAATVEKQSDRQIKVVRSDNGKEFVNAKFQEYFAKKGIVHQTTVPYTPQQNGVAERANRTLVEMARCMLETSSLPQSLWGEAVNTAVYIRNRAPTKVLGDVTPYELWNGRKPSVSHWKTFGCDAIVLRKGPQSKGRQFMPKGVKLKFVGYADSTKGFRLYDSKSRKIQIARDVIFFEECFEKIPDKSNKPEMFCTEILKQSNFELGQETDNAQSEASSSNLPSSSNVSRRDFADNINLEASTPNEMDDDTDMDEFSVVNKEKKIINVLYQSRTECLDRTIEMLKIWKCLIRL